MIAPLRDETQPVSGLLQYRSNLKIIAILCGLIVGGLFSWMWSGLSGVANFAFWPLGLALAFVFMSFIAIKQQGSMRWDLLFIGQIFGVIGATLLFFASL